MRSSGWSHLGLSKGGSRRGDVDVIPVVLPHTFCWSTDGGLLQKDSLGLAADEGSFGYRCWLICLPFGVLRLPPASDREDSHTSRRFTILPTQSPRGCSGTRTCPLSPAYSLPSSTTLSTSQAITIQTRPSIMFTNIQSARSSTDNFTAIFKAASNEYQRVTGKHLDSHPFAIQLETCNSPEAVSTVIRTQARAFSRFCKGDENLMAWLDPTIKILSMLSVTLGDGIGLVSYLVHFL